MKDSGEAHFEFVHHNISTNVKENMHYLENTELLFYGSV